MGVVYGISKLFGDRTKLLEEIRAGFADIHPHTTQILEADQQRKLYLTIGQALSAWAHMEEVLVHVLALLLRIEAEKAGLILYSIINFNVWVNLIDELFQIDDLYGPLRQKWNKYSDRLRRLKDDRDRLAHHAVSDSGEALVQFGDTGLRPGRLDVRQKSRKYKPMSVDDVLDFSEAASGLGMDLAKFSAEMVEMWRASLQKSS